MQKLSRRLPAGVENPAVYRADDRDEETPKDGTDLFEYFGALKEDPLRDKFEAE